MTIDLDIANLDIDDLRKLALPLNGSLDDERNVIEACLAHENIGTSQVVSPFSHMRADEDAVFASRFIACELDGVSSETVFDFIIKNSAPIRYTPVRVEIDGLVYVDDATLRSIFHDRDHGWDDFRLRFPESKGAVELSRVGLNRQGDEALVCFGAQYDWLMGFGKYVFLTRGEESWTVSGEVGAWRS